MQGASLGDIRASFPLRQDNEEVAAFSADAHKTVRVREQDQGLLGFRQQERLLFYQVAPFGAVFSSHWFARGGGSLLESCISFSSSRTCSCFTQMTSCFGKIARCCPWEPLWCSVSLLALGFPSVGPSFRWDPKSHGLAGNLTSQQEASVYQQTRARKPSLYLNLASQEGMSPESFLIKCLVLCSGFCSPLPELRPWPCCLCDDMRSPLGTSYSVDPAEWSSLQAHLSDSLRFLSTPRGTDIPIGSTLLSARRKTLSCKTDLRLVPISSRRIWMRVADPASSRRKLSAPSVEMLQYLLWWCRNPWPWRPLTLPPTLRPMPLGKATPVA